jgi:hypothetical protein
MNTVYWVLLVLLLLLVVALANWDTIKLNVMVYLIIHRGLLAPNCFWWSVSETILQDASGVEMYNRLKNEHPNDSFVTLSMWGRTIYMITNPKYLPPVLENSPFIFGAGKHKKRFFSTFMKGNVGISEGCPWKYRRSLNEYVLNSKQSHHYLPQYSKDIDNLLSRYQKPANYQQFSFLGKKLAGLVVFNDPNPSDTVFKILSESNNPWSLLFNIPQPSMQEYMQYVKQELAHPRPRSMIELGKKFGASDYEMIQQIPHWVFPIAGLIAVAVPRVMVLVCNTPHVYKKILDGAGPAYLRKCILETFRLNNQVVTLFRTLLQDYTFENGEHFKKGDQFVIFTNPVMRSERFAFPNAFIPERWGDPELEKSYFAIMFSQGPQNCPGKEIALDLATHFLDVIFKSYLITGVEPRLNTRDVPQMINPCTIKFSYA